MGYLLCGMLWVWVMFGGMLIVDVGMLFKG